MKQLVICLITVVLYVPGPLFAAETVGDDDKLGVGDGIIAERDGQPGTLLARVIQPSEYDLSDVADRRLDVIYGRKYGASLTMDVYLPKSNPNGIGVVQIVSGGLWSGPEYRRMQAFMNSIGALLENGFTVFAVMHCSQPKFTWLDVRDDVPRSVRYIRHHARDFGIQPSRIGLLGFSSGGHLALLAATTATDGKPNTHDPVNAESSRVQAVVAYYPNSDLLNYGKHDKLITEHFREQGLKMDAAFDFHTWDEGRCIFVPMTDREVRGVLREISPVTHVTQDAPPILLFHGDEDKLVPIQQSEEFERRMRRAGAQCELVVAKGQGHSWPEPLAGERDRIAKWLHHYLTPSAKKGQPE